LDARVSWGGGVGGLHEVSEGVETTRDNSEEADFVSVLDEEGGSVLGDGPSVEVVDIVGISGVTLASGGVSVEDGDVWAIWVDTIEFRGVEGVGDVQWNEAGAVESGIVADGLVALVGGVGE